MPRRNGRAKFALPRLAVLCLAACLLACACSLAPGAAAFASSTSHEEGFVRILGQEPDSMDPQSAPEGSLVALNVFDRLMETRPADNGTVVEPSLALSADVSANGLTYSFALRPDVKFSNGSALTADDVRFTFERLIRSTDHHARNLLSGVVGAGDLAAGKTDSLAGFTVTGDLSFTIELEHPRPAFLAALSSTRASVLDEQTTLEAGGDFGQNPDALVGTGPFILKSWNPKSSIVLEANPSCWSGQPACRGAEVEFYANAMPYRTIYQHGELDILDITDMDIDADYFSRGDLYRKNLARTIKTEVACVLLDGNAEQFGDPRVREALSAALDREVLLQTAADGRGVLESGIIPSRLSVGKSKLHGEAHDPDRARALLAEAGLSGGFDLQLPCPADASAEQRCLLDLIAAMWNDIGVRTTVVAVETDSPREAAPCATAFVTAAYDDPESVFANLIATYGDLFGSVPATSGADIAGSLAEVASIENEQTRIEVYRAAERQLVADEHLVIPLYARAQIFVVADGVSGAAPQWNGSPGIDLRTVSIDGRQG